MKTKIQLKDLQRPEYSVDRKACVTNHKTGESLGQLNVSPEQLASLITFKTLQKASISSASLSK